MTAEIESRPRIAWAPVMAGLSLALGTGLVVAGVYLLAGPGWALVAGAVPCFALAAVVIRGLRA